MFRKRLFPHHFDYSPEIFLRTAVCSWFFASLVNILISGLEYMSLDFVQSKTYLIIITAALFILAFVLLSIAEHKFKGKLITEYLSVGLYTCLALSSLLQDYSLSHCIILIVIGVIVISYALNRGCFCFFKVDIKKRTKYIIVGAAVFVFAAVLCVNGVLKYRTYHTSNFDMGIFLHMFHNMKETFLPNTTCERDYLLSHFSVHFSPILYLILPIYYIFPFAETLLILQALILASSAIPLLLIARELGFSHKTSAFITLLCMAFPAVSMGCNYDFHENCFLLPLLLWVFYFSEKEKYIPLTVVCVLTLMIKEDVFIYLIVFGLYLILSKRKMREGTLICVGSLLYFGIAYSILTSFGLGIMDSRYENMIYGDGSLIGVIKTLVLNPMYSISQLSSHVDGEFVKLSYLLKLFVPLAFIPFVTKKLTRYILITPIILNLISSYPHQCDLSFQYHFGICAFLFYITVLNLSDLGREPKRYLSVIACFSTVILYVCLVFSTRGFYLADYIKNKSTYDKMDEVLTTYVPDDSSVSCTTYLLPHLYKRAEIYESFYHKDKDGYKTDVDYLVLFLRDRYLEQSTTEAEFYLERGYSTIYRDDMLWIIKKD